jgi:hypothetical protein
MGQRTEWRLLRHLLLYLASQLIAPGFLVVGTVVLALLQETLIALFGFSTTSYVARTLVIVMLFAHLSTELVFLASITTHPVFLAQCKQGDLLASATSIQSPNDRSYVESHCE